MVGGTFEYDGIFYDYGIQQLNTGATSYSSLHCTESENNNNRNKRRILFTIIIKIVENSTIIFCVSRQARLIGILVPPHQ